MRSVKNVTVAYHDDFNKFAARTAYALRHKITYRSDGGRMARGLVRASGDLGEIHAYLKERNTPNDTNLRMEAHFFRRKEPKATKRWVMSIRFKPKDVIHGDNEVLTPSKEATDRIRKHRLDQFIDRAIILAEDMPGEIGKRVRRMLDIADCQPFPRNRDLWYYSPPAVKRYVSFYTDDKQRRVMTRGSRGRLPFDGYAHPTGSWRNYPFRTIAMHYSDEWSDSKVKARLAGIDKGVAQSRDEINRELGKSSLGGGSAYGPLVERFVEHAKALEKSPSHLYHAFSNAEFTCQSR